MKGAGKPAEGAGGKEGNVDALGARSSLSLSWSSWLLDGDPVGGLGRIGRISWIRSPAASERYERRASPHSLFLDLAAFSGFPLTKSGNWQYHSELVPAFSSSTSVRVCKSVPVAFGVIRHHVAGRLWHYDSHPRSHVSSGSCAPRCHMVSV